MKLMQAVLTVLVISVVALTGCSQKPQAANSSQAIEQAANLQTVEAKVQYLVKEANAFVNNQKFDEAINTAKYILSELDKNSQEAQGIIAKAQEQLKKVATEKVDAAASGLKSKLGDLGK
jgi:hypothetical protein